MKENGFAAESDPFTEKIIGLAIRVHAELGSGFLESVYQQALIIELQDAGIPFEAGSLLKVFYKGRPAGNFVADLIVENKVLLELKAVEIISPAHEVQTVNYLKATGLDLGLILNFGSATLQIKRKHRERRLPPVDLRLQEV